MYPGQFPGVPPGVPPAMPGLPLPGVIPPMMPAPFPMHASMAVPGVPLMAPPSSQPARTSLASSSYSGSITTNSNSRSDTSSVPDSSRRQLYSGPPRISSQIGSTVANDPSSSIDARMRPPPGIIAQSKDNNRPGVVDSMGHTRLYVGQLTAHMTDSLMLSIFECCGEVQDWTRLKDSFGFVTFTQPIAASFCLSILHEKQVFGRSLKVKASSKMSRAIETAKEARKSLKQQSDPSSSNGDTSSSKSLSNDTNDKSLSEEDQSEETDLDTQLLKMSEIDALLTKFRLEHPHLIAESQRPHALNEDADRHHRRSRMSRSPHRSGSSVGSSSNGSGSHYLNPERIRLLQGRTHSRSRSRSSGSRIRQSSLEGSRTDRMNDSRRSLQTDSPTHRSREMKLAFKVDTGLPGAMAVSASQPSISETGPTSQSSTKSAADSASPPRSSAVGLGPSTSEHSEGAASSSAGTTTTDARSVSSSHSAVSSSSSSVMMIESAERGGLEKKEEEVSDAVKELRRKKVESTRDIVGLIPSEESELFEFPMDWQTIEQHKLIDSAMAKWCDTRFQEYLNESDSEFCQFTVGLLHQRANPRVLCTNLRMVLQKDTNSFVSKLWRRLVYEMLRAMHRL